MKTVMPSQRELSERDAADASHRGRFSVYCNSGGNFFFQEICSLIATGLRQSGHEVVEADERSGFLGNVDCHIVIAPHEFFYLGTGTDLRKGRLPENLVLVNTEQPSTQWFTLAFDCFRFARAIWDIEYGSARRIQDQGFPCTYLPLGYLPDFQLYREQPVLEENETTRALDRRIVERSYFRGSWTERPIDVLFLGGLTPRRTQFLEDIRPTLAGRTSVIETGSNAGPLIPGKSTHMNTETSVGLAQRSKVLLNIHRGNDPYFEWHRIVMLGIWQGALVISELSGSAPPFVPGVDYIEAPLSEIPARVRYYLSTKEGRAEARKIVTHGRRTLMEKCRITDALDTALRELDALAAPAREGAISRNAASGSGGTAKRRVCVVVNDVPESIHGYTPETAYEASAELLAQRGYDVTVLHVANEDLFGKPMIDFVPIWGKRRGVTHLALPNIPSLKIEYARRHTINSYLAYVWLKEHSFDVVHFPEKSGVGFYSLMAKEEGLAFVNTLMCVHLHGPTSWQKLKKAGYVSGVGDLELSFMERQVVERADVLFSPTASLRDWISDRGWKLPPVGTVQQYQLPALSKVPETPRLPKTIREIVYINQDNDLRSMKLFCDAIDRLTRRPEDVILLSFENALQNAAALAYFEKRAGQWGLKVSPVQVADIEGAIRYLRSGERLGVYASQYEVYPLFAIRCMKAQVPLLMSRTPAIQEMIVQGDIDLVSFPWRADALSALMGRVIGADIVVPRLTHDPAGAGAAWITWHDALFREPHHCRPELLPGETLPLISVCLVTHNRPEFLSQALESLRAQTYDHFEVVVVDDGSDKPGAMAYLDSLEPEFAERGWRICREPNRYLGAARNTAARQAKGEYLLFMDDDNLAKPDELSMFVEVARRTGGDVLTCVADTFAGDRPPAPGKPPLARWLPLGGALAPGLFANTFGDANALVRKTVFESLGGFTEDYGVTHEDWEFFVKVVIRGHRLEVIPEPLFWYRVSEGTMIKTTDLHANHLRNIRPYLEAIPQEFRELIQVSQGMAIQHHALMEKVEYLRESAPLKALTGAARILAKAGQTDLLVQVLTEGINSARHARHQRAILEFLMEGAQILADAGHGSAALPLLQQARKLVAGSNDAELILLAEQALSSMQDRLRNVGKGSGKRSSTNGQKGIATPRSIEVPSDASIGQSEEVVSPKKQQRATGLKSGLSTAAGTALERAAELSRRELVEEAVDQFLQAVRAAPNDRRVYLSFARALLDFKRFKDALAVIDQYQGKDNDPEALSIAGSCNVGLDHVDIAQGLADRALSIDPRCAAALTLRGVLAFADGDPVAAEKYFTDAIKSDLTLGEAYTNVGIMKWGEGAMQEALDWLEKGCIQSPTSTDELSHYHAAISTMGELSRGEQILSEAWNRFPSSKRLTFFLIDLLLKQEKYPAAMRIIEHAMYTFGTDEGMIAAALAVRAKVGPLRIEQGATQAPTVSLCVIVRNEEKNLPRCLLSARPVVDEMVVVDTGSEDASRRVAEACGAKLYDFPWTNDFSAARNFSLSKASGDWVLILDADELLSPADHDRFASFIRDHAAENTAFSLTTRNYVRGINTVGLRPNRGEYGEEAGTGWYPSVKVRLFPNRRGILFTHPVHELVEPSLLSAGISKNILDIPVHHYGKLDPDRVARKAEQYYQMGKAKVAQQGEDADALFELAVQAGELRKYEEAIDLWQRVLAMRPGDPSAQYMLGSTCLSLGQFRDAHAATRRALELDPSMKEAALNLALCEMCIGDNAEAVRLLEGITRADADYLFGTALLAAVAFVVGDAARGRALVEEVREKGFACTDYFYLVSRNLVASGRAAGARVLLEAAISGGSASPEVHAALAALQKNTSPSGADAGVSKANAPLVSIVVLTFNQLQFTKECIASVERHTPESHEIIFVDNGSSDGTVAWVKKIAAENRTCRCVLNPENLGFARGCNQGIRAARGEYIVLLNNDVVVTEDWLGGMLETLQHVQHAGVVGPMTNYAGGVQKVPTGTCGKIEELDGFAARFREDHRYRRVFAWRLAGFCLLFRRDLCDRIGYLDEDFGNGNYEDDDFCLRAALDGFRNVIAADVFVHHYGSRSFAGNNIDYRAAMASNREIFLRKWGAVDGRSEIGKKIVPLNTVIRAGDLKRKGDIDGAATALQGGIRLSPSTAALYRELAWLLIEHGRIREASGVIESTPDEVKKDPEWLEIAGACLHAAGDPALAEQCADKALSLRPTSTVALVLKGRILAGREDLKDAEDCFRKAVDSDPSEGEAYAGLGSLFWRKGDRECGFAMVRKAFLLSPLKPAIRDLFAHTMDSMASQQSACTDLAEACALYPDHRGLATLHAAALAKTAKYEQALALVQQAIVMFGVDDDLLMMALEWRIKVGTPELQKASQTRATVSLCMIVKDEENNLPRCLLDAARIVDEIIVVDTGSSDRTEEIAAAFGAKVFSTKWTGDFSCARNASIAEASGDWIFVLDADELVSPSDHDEFRKLTADTRKKNLAYSFTTRNYVRQPDVQDWRKNDGRYQEEAGTGWIPSSKVRLFRRNPDVQFAQPVHESVEQSLRKSGIDIVHCRIQIHHYGKLDPRRTREKARVYRELGEAKLNNEPDDAKALYELAVQEHENGNYERALELWMKLASRFPDSAKAQMGLGSACVALGKHADAEAPLRAAVKLDPSFKEAHVKYALTLIHLGRESEAVQLMEQLSHAHAEYPHARAALAAALLCLGEKSRGLAIIKKMKDDGIAADDFFSDVARDLRAGGRRDLAVRLLEALAEDEIISAKLGSQLVAYYKEQAMQNHSLVGG